MYIPRKCSYCGCNLDPGETCECRVLPEPEPEEKKPAPVRVVYRNKNRDEMRIAR